jgi:hypothetical protein
VGLEVFLHRDFTKRLAGFISYTLSRTEDTIGNQTFRAAGDSTHVLSAVLGYDLGRHWRVGARLYVRSGRPYTVLCATPDCSAGQSASTYQVTGELPGFFRVDARLEKKWIFSGGQWIAGTIEVFNGLDQGEVTSVTYSPDRGMGLNKQNPIILPSVGIEAGF